MADTSEDLALELSLRQMELVAAGVSQLRTAMASALGFILTIDAIFAAAALERNADGTKTIVGAVTLLALIGLSAWVLVPKPLVSWPTGKDLLDDQTGSVADRKERLVQRFDDELIPNSKSGLETLTRKSLALVALGCLTVAFWAWVSTSAPGASKDSDRLRTGPEGAEVPGKVSSFHPPPAPVVADVADAAV